MKKDIKSKKDESIKNVVALPQNILQIGERVYDDKNIYIHQKVYKAIRKFSANKTINESGGILVGTVVAELNKTNIIIDGFIEARFNEATATTLTFTHKTWEYFHSEINKKYKNSKIVGWIHTHPNFGIFLSENDKFIQNNFFKEDFQVAYVVDPIQNSEGFFFWIDKKIEKCPGFYLYDKNGVKINSLMDKHEVIVDTKGPQMAVFNIVLSIVLMMALLFSFTKIYSMSATIQSLEAEMKDMKKTINNQNMVLQQMLSAVIPQIQKGNTSQQAQFNENHKETQQQQPMGGNEQ